MLTPITQHIGQLSRFAWSRIAQQTQLFVIANTLDDKDVSFAAQDAVWLVLCRSSSAPWYAERATM